MHDRYLHDYDFLDFDEENRDILFFMHRNDYSIESKRKNTDNRYKIMLKMALYLKKNNYNIFIDTFSRELKKNSNYIKLLEDNFIKYDFFSNKKNKKKNFFLVMVWYPCIEGVKGKFDCPIIYYENGFLKDSVLIDKNGILGKSQYFYNLNTLVEKNYDNNKCNKFLEKYKANDNSKRPQNQFIDIPNNINGKYVFIPTQKHNDISLKTEKNQMLKSIKIISDYCKKKNTPLVIKIHPHLEGELYGKQFLLIKLLKIKNKHVYISNSSINYLIKNALFTVTINGSTIMDNFINQTPVLTLGKSMFSNTKAVIYNEDILKGLEIMFRKEYNIEEMLDKQKKIIYFYLKNNLFLEYDTEKNVNILLKKI